jgi:leucyl/phenylalanyl-tRNA--protein transferase
MPIYFLHPDLPVFPHPEMADESGILAVGGDLSLERLLTAYSFGIFPWYNEDEPVTWWSPDPRSIVLPGQVRISKSMRPYLKRFELRVDTAFHQVIHHCRKIPRNGQPDTWITADMEKAFVALRDAGYAHSFETWHEGRLIGGLYGVSLGKGFFGESMFSLETNASKFAFIRLSQWLRQRAFTLIDCQVPSEHLARMGCTTISRSEYLDWLRKNLLIPTLKGKWKTDS